MWSPRSSPALRSRTGSLLGGAVLLLGVLAAIVSTLLQELTLEPLARRLGLAGRD